MPTTNATPTVTRGEIVALRRSAVLAGNDALVADCDRVLTPFGRRDLDALDVVTAIPAGFTNGHPSQWPAHSTGATTRVCPRCKGSGRSLSLGKCHRCDGRELVEIGTDAASTARYEAEFALPFGEALPADWDPAAAAHAIEQGFRGLLGCAPAYHTESAYVLTCCGDESARGTFAEMCAALQRHPQCCRFCTPRMERPYYADDGNIDGLTDNEREDADAADMRRGLPIDDEHDGGPEPCRHASCSGDARTGKRGFCEVCVGKFEVQP